MEPNFVFQSLLLAVALASVISAIVSARRKPPISEELYRDFVSKAELRELKEQLSREREEFRSHVQTIYERIEAQSRTTARSFSDIERLLHEIAGRLQEHLEQTR